MARQRLRAEFFVSPNGDIAKKESVVCHRLRIYIFNRDNRACSKCGDAVSFFTNHNMFSREYKRTAHVHHVFPRSMGGKTHIHNLELLCEGCHSS